MSPKVGGTVRPARANPLLANSLPPAVEQAWKNDDLDKLIKLAESTKIDVRPPDPSNASEVLMVTVQIESSKRAVKRIKLEFDQFKSSTSKAHSPLEESSGPDSPVSPIKRAARTPQKLPTPVVS